MSSEQKPILVGVDDSGTSTAAVVAAVQEAARRGRRLEIVHSTHYLYLPSHDNEAPLPVNGAAEDYPRQALLEAERTARATDPTVEIAVSVNDGDPIENLIRRSHDAELIVLGTHRTPSIWGALVRSIGQSVAAHAHCPVMLVNHRREAGPETRPIVVVGVSPSPGGRQALRYAFEQARARRAGLLAVRCAPVTIWASATPMAYGTYLYADWERTELAVIDQELAALVKEFPDVVVERKALNEGTPEALEALSAQAELLVVGARRRDVHWLSRLGPVASWLVHHAQCPVVVVGRPPAEPAEPAVASDPAAATTSTVGHAEHVPG